MLVPTVYTLYACFAALLYCICQNEATTTKMMIMTTVATNLCAFPVVCGCVCVKAISI